MRYLHSGAKIAIVAPSAPIAPEYLAEGVARLRAAGFEVDVMPGVEGPVSGVFSAKDEVRASDLSRALSDPKYDVIWCTRGGYGAVRTVQLVDPQLWGRTDKVVVGFSDITAIHSLAVRAGHPSLLGPMLKHISVHGIDSPDVQRTLALLRGEEVCVECQPMPESRVGRAEAVVVGGNLSLVYSLVGTPAEIMMDGNILFIEDLCEPLYHIDRMIQSLKYSGALSRLAGIIVGQMTDMREAALPFGRNAYQIVADAVAEYGYPVLLGYPSGHEPDRNEPVLLGCRAVLDVRPDAASLTMRM